MVATCSPVKACREGGSPIDLCQVACGPDRSVGGVPFAMQEMKVYIVNREYYCFASGNSKWYRNRREEEKGTRSPKAVVELRLQEPCAAFCRWVDRRSAAQFGAAIWICQ